MNFYEELAGELTNARITGWKIVEVPDELKPTAKDYVELEDKISRILEDNYKMRILSEQYARDSYPCGEVKSFTRRKR